MPRSITTREAQRRYRRRLAAKVRQYVRELKESEPCSRCGLCFPYWVMEFHHRPDEHKRFGISASTSGRSMAAVKAEIAKCDLVCANCHRAEHKPNQPRANPPPPFNAKAFVDSALPWVRA